MCLLPPYMSYTVYTVCTGFPISKCVSIQSLFLPRTKLNKQITHCHQLINVAHERMITGSVYYQSETGERERASKGER